MGGSYSYSNPHPDLIINGSNIDAAGPNVWVNEHLKWEDRVSIVTAYDIVCGVGTVTNAFPILLTFLTDLKKTNVNIMVANMSSANLAMCLSVFIQNVYILYREQLPELGCSILGYFQMVLCIQNFIFPPFLALNRYVSLFHSHLYDQLFTRKRTSFMIVATWLMCALVPSMFALAGYAKYDTDNEHCCIVTKGSFVWSAVYWLLIVLVLLGACDGTIVYCNIKIFNLLRHHGAAKLSVNVVQQNREMLYYLMGEMLLPLTADSIYHIVKFVYFEREIVFFRWFFAALVFAAGGMRGVLTVTLLGPYKREGRRVLRKMAKRILGDSRTKVTPSAPISTTDTKAGSQRKSGMVISAISGNKPA